MNKTYILFYCFLGISALLYSQEIVPITKSMAVSKVIEENETIKISEEDFNQSKADYRQTNTVVLPNSSVSHTAIATTNPLMAFGSKWNQ